SVMEAQHVALPGDATQPLAPVFAAVEQPGEPQLHRGPVAARGVRGSAVRLSQHAFMEGDQLVVDRKPAGGVVLTGAGPLLTPDELWSGFSVHHTSVREQLRPRHLCRLWGIGRGMDTA